MLLLSLLKMTIWKVNLVCSQLLPLKNRLCSSWTVFEHSVLYFPSSFRSTAHLVVEWHSRSISCELLYQLRTNEKTFWMSVLLNTSGCTVLWWCRLSKYSLFTICSGEYSTFGLLCISWNSPQLKLWVCIQYILENITIVVNLVAVKLNRADDSHGQWHCVFGLSVPFFWTQCLRNASREFFFKFATNVH